MENNIKLFIIKLFFVYYDEHNLNEKIDNRFLDSSDVYNNHFKLYKESDFYKSLETLSSEENNLIVPFVASNKIIQFKLSDELLYYYQNITIDTFENFRKTLSE